MSRTVGWSAANQHAHLYIPSRHTPRHNIPINTLQLRVQHLKQRLVLTRCPRTGPLVFPVEYRTVVVRLGLGGRTLVGRGGGGGGGGFAFFGGGGGAGVEVEVGVVFDEGGRHFAMLWNSIVVCVGHIRIDATYPGEVMLMK